IFVTHNASGLADHGARYWRDHDTESVGRPAGTAILKNNVVMARYCAGAYSHSGTPGLAVGEGTRGRDSQEPEVPSGYFRGDVLGGLRSDLTGAGYAPSMARTRLLGLLDVCWRRVRCILYRPTHHKLDR